MSGYEKGTPAYFATPPVNLINAFNESLKQITRSTPSLEERFILHREASRLVKEAAKEIGLKEVPVESSVAANGMTAVSLVDLRPLRGRLLIPARSYGVLPVLSLPSYCPSS